VNIDHLRKDIEENQKRKFTRFIEIPDEDRLVVLSEGKRKELENILDEYHSKTGTKKRELQLADENINDIIDNKDAVAVRKTAFGTNSAAEVNLN
jgi:nitric oxide reductase large subunit